MSKLPIAFAVAIAALAALPVAAGAWEQSTDGVRTERSMVRHHKMHHVRYLTPRVYDEGYRESYGYAYEPWVTTGTYNGVNRFGGAPGSVW